MKRIVFGLLMAALLCSCTKPAVQRELTVPQEVLNEYLKDYEIVGDENGYTVTVVAPRFSTLLNEGLIDSADLSKDELDRLIQDHDLEMVEYSFEVSQDSEDEIQDAFFMKVAYEVYCDAIAGESFEVRLLQDGEDGH